MRRPFAALRARCVAHGGHTGERSTRMNTGFSGGVFRPVKARPVAWFSAFGFAAVGSHDPQYGKLFVCFEAGVYGSSPLRQG